MRESDIRPRDLLSRYLALVREEGRELLRAGAGFVPVSCPGCGAGGGDTAFDKEGFRYVLCPACGSLFVSPRPSRELLDRYGRESKAVQFWSTHFYKQTAEARREMIFRPRAQDLAALASRRGAEDHRTLVDIGCGYGLLLEELAGLEAFDTALGIEPAGDLAAICRAKGFTVIEAKVETIPPGTLQADVATAFEVLEHVFDPGEFLRAAASLLRPDGVLLLTTLTVSGFDIQVLWDRSNSASPPQHLNLLSLEGIRRLVEREGFSVEQLTTPGRLDLEIVDNAARDDPTLPLPRCVRRILDAGPACRQAFQAFLREHDLSSHVRVVARRAG